jgi:phosphoglycerate dehydrogenase-like enzyme
MASDVPTIAVLLAEGDHPPAGLQAIAAEATVVPARTADELERVIGQAEVLVVFAFRTTALRQVWAAARRLRWIRAAAAYQAAYSLTDHRPGRSTSSVHAG